MISNIVKKIKHFWEEERSEILLGFLIFLLVASSFGIGWILGSGAFQRPPIIVNCPKELYQRN